ncbi:MAG: histidine phosphatase family protein [Fuerstiella sp.]
MRHSHAVSDNPAYIDEERPLTDNGIHLIRQTSTHIKPWPVQKILASSAIRTQQTAKHVLPTFAQVDKVDVLDELYLATVEQYVHSLKQLDADIHCAMLIGHNPGIANLIANWSGRHLSVSPCTVAVFRLPIDEWKTLKLMNSQGQTMEAFISKGQQIE